MDQNRQERTRMDKTGQKMDKNGQDWTRINKNMDKNIE